MIGWTRLLCANTWQRFAQAKTRSICKISSIEEFTRAQKWTIPYLPRSIIMSQWLKINMDRWGGIGSSDNVACYVDQWPNPNIMAGIDFLKVYGSDHFPLMIMFTDHSIHSAHVQKVEKFMHELVQSAGLSKQDGIEIQALYPEWRPLIDKIFEDQLSFNAYEKVWPMKGFMMDSDEREYLMKDHKIKLPSGFVLESLRAEDAKLVDDTWEFRVKDTSLPWIQRRIRDFPSVCLREKEGEKRLASFMILDETGLLGHLYTDPKFRGRGLSSVVELNLAKVVIEKGHIPVKAVKIENTNAVAITQSSPFWKYIGDCHWLLYGNKKAAGEFENAHGGKNGGVDVLYGDL